MIRQLSFSKLSGNLNISARTITVVPYVNYLDCQADLYFTAAQSLLETARPCQGVTLNIDPITLVTMGTMHSVTDELSTYF